MRLLVFLLAVAGLLSGPPALLCGADALQAKAEAHFEREIRPALVAHCLKCHGEKKQQGKLRLDSRAAMLAGGESGPAIVPGKPDESLLLEALRHESFEMPPSGQLPEKTILQFAAWIAADAVWPETSSQLRSDTAISDEDRQWWAFQPVLKPDPPMLENDDWSANEVDRFVLHRLRQQQMAPAPPAARATLLRRLHFDLLGMPPTPQQIDAFLADDSPDAWERLVDRLLDDPRYGEHWARYWLDLVRYSESDGWNQDAHRPRIWRYRDYVVGAFNGDKPYPQFVREQLAGDEIPGDDPQHDAAAGLLRLGIYEYNQRDARGHWNDIMNEMTDVAGDVFLGMSMACARCHDHKFDPVLQRDYFQLRAFFEPISWRDDIPAATDQQLEEHRRQQAEWEQATAEIRAKIDALVKPYHDKKWKSTVAKFPLDIQACFHKPAGERTSWENQMAYLVSRQFLEEGGGPLKSISKEDKAKHEELNKELAKFDKLKPKPLPLLMTVTDFDGEPAATMIPDGPEQPVAPGYLTVFGAAPFSRPSEPLTSATTGRRTALAQWIARADNSLTTRVIVNRIWQQHFGEGLVATPNDFGRLGQPPSHPQLLDWLTATFIEDGWSFKKLHKRILMSAAWRQSAEHPLANEYSSRDPAEKLLWRARVRRLRAEQIRDALLLASGELQQKLGGPSVEEAAPRRGLYVKSFRNKTETFLHAFDMAAGLKSVASRNTTTTPTQSLRMINGDYVLGRARKLAARLKSEKLAGEALVRRAMRLTWGREPSSDELRQSLDFLAASDEQPNDADGAKGKHPDDGPLVDFCHVLLNANEFLYVD